MTRLYIYIFFIEIILVYIYETRIVYFSWTFAEKSLCSITSMIKMLILTTTYAFCIWEKIFFPLHSYPSYFVSRWIIFPHFLIIELRNSLCKNSFVNNKFYSIEKIIKQQHNKQSYKFYQESFYNTVSNNFIP